MRPVLRRSRHAAVCRPAHTGTPPQQSPPIRRGGWREPGQYEGFLATRPLGWGRPSRGLARKWSPRWIPRHTPPRPRPRAPDPLAAWAGGSVRHGPSDRGCYQDGLPRTPRGGEWVGTRGDGWRPVVAREAAVCQQRVAMHNPLSRARNEIACAGVRGGGFERQPAIYRAATTHAPRRPYTSVRPPGASTRTSTAGARRDAAAANSRAGRSRSPDRRSRGASTNVPQ